MHNTIQEQSLTLTLSTLISNTINCMAHVTQSVVTKYYLINVFIIFNTHIILYLINITKSYEFYVNKAIRMTQ